MAAERARGILKTAGGVDSNAALLGVTLFEFLQNLWHQKVPSLSYRALCVILFTRVNTIPA